MEFKGLNKELIEEQANKLLQYIAKRGDVSFEVAAKTWIESKDFGSADTIRILTKALELKKGEVK